MSGILSGAGRQRFPLEISTREDYRFIDFEWQRWRGRATLSGKASASCDCGSFSMKAGDQYLKFVRWEDENAAYVGYCPDLFPFGGVCHGKSEEETFSQLCELVREEVEDLLRNGKELPASATRAMRDAIP